MPGQPGDCHQRGRGGRGDRSVGYSKSHLICGRCIGRIYDQIKDGIDGETAKQQTAADEMKQVQLAEQVRNIALLDGIHQHLSRSRDQGDSHDALLNIISQNIGILFGVSHCILFGEELAPDAAE